MEVVLVDDGAPDNTAGNTGDDTADVIAEFARGLVPLRVVSGPRAGRAAARNTGAEHSWADYLVFLDDDILIGPDFVAAHLAAARPHQFVHGPLRELATAERLVTDLANASPAEVTARRDELVAGTVKRHRLFANALERAVEAMATGQVPDVAPWLGSVGANVGMHRAAWRAVGGFDEGFGTTWGCEDLELGLRLYRSGVRRAFDTRASGIHLTHRRPDRWHQHDVNLDRFRRIHPIAAVLHLHRLLGPDGDVHRYVAAVTETQSADLDVSA